MYKPLSVRCDVHTPRRCGGRSRLEVRMLLECGRPTLYFWLRACFQDIELEANVSSNFLKSVCTENFFCATFYQNSSEFAMTCMIYVHRHFLKENWCALQFFLCALVSQLVCVRTQPRGNIARGPNRTEEFSSLQFLNSDSVCELATSCKVVSWF